MGHPAIPKGCHHSAQGFPIRNRDTLGFLHQAKPLIGTAGFCLVSLFAGKDERQGRLDKRCEICSLHTGATRECIPGCRNAPKMKNQTSYVRVLPLSISPIRSLPILIALLLGSTSPSKAQLLEPPRGGPRLDRDDTAAAKAALTHPSASDSARDGIYSGLQEAGFNLGAGLGNNFLGGTVSHDTALARLDYGWVFSDLLGGDHWYGGHLEIVEELFGGSQIRPHTAYVAGETTLLRYNFATGASWIPFCDAGIGLSATDIGHPDLGSTGEFNGQGGVGVHWFWRKNSALTFEYRFLHISNGGLRKPNEGVNVNMLAAGMSWFF